MQNSRSSHLTPRRRAIACAIGVAVAATIAPTPTLAAEAAAGLYSVINLGPEAGAAALLNERGQAAFGSIGYDGITNGYFDGDRLHRIGTLGGSYGWVWGLNKHGVVVGEAEDAEEHSNILGFTWTVRRGTRALPGTSVASARAINDRNYVVGFTSAPPTITGRARGWSPDGTVTALGPVPLSLSEAFAVNQGGNATGYADVTGGDIHAMFWTPAGVQTDLGTLGGQRAFGLHINNCDAVAGVSDDASNERELGFYWTRNSGMVPIRVEGGGSRLVSGLNCRGEVVGDTTVGERSLAYQWSLRRGLVTLPYGSATRSDVFDINNKSEMVGLIERGALDGGGLRAVRWPGLAAPIDLNTRLHRPPAGLVLEAAAAINEDGVILAHSNAGLVMLRPGKHGTDAPVLGPIIGLPEAVELGQDVALTIGFVDANAAQTHSASVEWIDGCASPAPLVRETRGVGQVSLQHRFCNAGFSTVKVTVTDSGGRSTRLQKDFVVESATLASLSGKGTLRGAPPLALHRFRDQPLQFALWAPLGRKAPPQDGVGKPLVILSGPFYFRSEKVASATAAGQQARVEGTGSLNGHPGYRFALEADAASGAQTGSPSRLRVRISHIDQRTGAEVLDYENGVASKAGTPGADSVVVDGSLRLRH
ncbi:MAG TPA: hypothetical protein VGC21_06640 [Telluria sp.]|jgi:probable HAF family extracellular repeat protein